MSGWIVLASAAQVPGGPVPPRSPRACPGSYLARAGAFLHREIGVAMAGVQGTVGFNYFLRSVAEGAVHGASLDDAVRSATALEAMLGSAERGTWVRATYP